MPQSLKVLIVEDNPADVELILRQLRHEGFEPDWVRVETEAAYLEHLPAGFDAILSDYTMPRFSGLRALELLKLNGRDIPLILISGTIGEETAVMAMKAGASDYLLKDRLGRLGAAIHHGLDQARLREALRATERRFESVFEQAAVGVVIAEGSGGKLVNVNRRLCQMLGYTAEELLQRTYRDIIHPDDVAADIDENEQISFGIIRDFSQEKRLLRIDGAHFWAQSFVAPLDRLEARPNLRITVIVDIDDRKRAQEALRENQERLSLALDAANDGLWDENLLSGQTYFSPRYYTMLGYKPDEFPANFKSFRNLLHPDDLIKVPQRIDEFAEQSNEVRAFEFRLKNKQGGWCWILSRGKIVERDARGRAVRIVGTHTDITERRQAADELRSTSTRLQHLLDHSPAVIYALKIGGDKIIPHLVSENITRLLGYTVPETMSYEWWVEHLHPDDRDRAIKSIGETLAKGESRTEYRFHHKNGAAMWVDDTRRLIRNAAGEPAELVGVWTDITEKKNLEAQLLRVQRMESIGTLAGGIAHDLNNILAPIMMSIEILKTKSNDSQATKILQTIEVSTRRGADIVRQVLSFARGLAGERIEVQPKHLLRDLETIIKDTFPKDIRMEFSISNDIWTILGDPSQIHQILLNLCVNARDAMPKGGRLVVDVENCVLDDQYATVNIQAKPGRYVKIGVIDSGTGIPPQIIGRIFEPFFTTKALNKGTGLGLSTVTAIVKSHDGVINVYSEVGKGTTFHVYLPAMEHTPEARKEQALQASLPRGNGETVLVVDDEASVVAITSQTLEAFGYRVLTATDGADALAVYIQHRNEIAVILSDMMMPVMDGPAAIHALRRVNPAIKIIAASGLNDNASVARVSEAGIKHFLTKPYTAGTMLKTIRAILDER